MSIAIPTLRGSLKPSSFDDVGDWVSRVQSLGSDVDSPTRTAVTTFVSGLKSDGVWNKIKRLNVYVGDDLNALKAPLKIEMGDTNDALNNFVASDYTSSIGLTGNGNTGAVKYIIPGIKMSDPLLGDNDNHL